jgi:hypothetical protein
MKLFAARRAGVGALTLATAMVGGSWCALHSYAHVSSCRTDPIVKLSNGESVNLSASIYDTATNVSKVTYTLYIPAGVAVTGETFTGNAFTGKEALVVYATNPAGSYTSNYVVSDANSSINVTGTTSLTSARGKALATSSVTGLTNQTITVAVSG